MAAWDSAESFAQLKEVVSQALAEFESADSESGLKALKSRWLGDSSPVSMAKKAIKDLAPSDKAVAGKNVSIASSRIAAAYQERTERLKSEALARSLREEAVDVTSAPARKLPSGRHPISAVQQEISTFFSNMGWDVAQGPEIEHEWFNFDALNIDVDHPARQMQDTFYIDGDGEDSHLVLRTHTSPVQGRVMTAGEPPFYMVCPGKVFRSDELDATHTPVFHQVEGLAVDKGITMAHLKGVLDAFAKAMFGEEARTRFRPSFFPFTEPSAELDLWFPAKKGGPGWIEWGGCGMVNRQVLISCGIDPDEYQGFAFGMGVERTLMLRHGISDMHDLVEGDVRFSQQFGLTGKGL